MFSLYFTPPSSSALRLLSEASQNVAKSFWVHLACRIWS